MVHTCVSMCMCTCTHVHVHVQHVCQVVNYPLTALQCLEVTTFPTLDLPSLRRLCLTKANSFGTSFSLNVSGKHCKVEKVVSAKNGHFSELAP